MSSKWPRIRWNQANAELANKPFADLFERGTKMDAKLGETMANDFEGRKYREMEQAIESACNALEGGRMESAQVRLLVVIAQALVDIAEHLHYGINAYQVEA